MSVSAGIGPSSARPVGPMVAARRFLPAADGLLRDVRSVRVELFGATCAGTPRTGRSCTVCSARSRPKWTSTPPVRAASSSATSGGGLSLDVVAC
ncbi:Serine dehydratase beta chain [Saccharopolyspora kobensis]|uniref:Serine dehydratase beta chain n=1 Tax=Saccharopolyspora kobensis TaxID=146035 RepID=A0A1H5ZBL8_9PSEU|nr:serine dehydratase beta chain [Saccharopolyspora kobensis]SEG33788.1 Serine dehydratase beta chain [Saccharopolyspora kobensis]SFF17002.1 Serine dehydratase beta chain [Saccharopolyspora kobensis]